ncbi:MAG TPA: class I SAM-dependent methyltransferase [Phototrophicaceae bacterium]|nr:class I SAM-dependent methyltransferase [Phototrophicaceae bacterium]
MDNPTNPNSTPSSPTAQSTPDSLGLGHSSGQRGAEILAGFRAEKYPSPDTVALSRWSGRIVARLLMRLAGSELPINFPMARFLVFEGLIRRAIPTDGSSFTLVEIACGLSPRGLRLAREFPHIKVIEIDLSSVIQDKQQRLRVAKNLHIPPNIEWRAADLGITPLAEVLENQPADVMVAEGLFGYFASEEVTQIAKGVYALLKPGGKLIGDVTWKAGSDDSKQVSSFFSRQAGEFKTVIKTDDEGQKLFLDAGYETVNVYHASQHIEEFKLPHPLTDITVIIEAKKHYEQSK